MLAGDTRPSRTCFGLEELLAGQITLDGGDSGRDEIGSDAPRQDQGKSSRQHAAGGTSRSMGGASHQIDPLKRFGW
ncbi:hypothetical protein, partial [Bradyrhizobium sp.]|uniref:hypothetical protein n=1 Tax=Bradyrhizobium sp. TaxID=376 RepID=UPI0025B9ED29